MLICSQCRFENPLENRFCQRCGAPLAQDMEVPASKMELEPDAAHPALRESADDTRALSPSSGSPEAPQSTTIIQLPETPEPSLPEPSLQNADTAALPESPSNGDFEPDGATSLLKPVEDLPKTAPPTSPDPDPWDENIDESRLESSSLEPSIAPTQTDLLDSPSDLQDAGLQGSDWPDSDLSEDDTVFGDTASDDDEDLPTMLLPMQLARLDSAGATHVGRQRDHNEDYFDTDTQLQYSESPLGRVLEARGLYILCDGMGGHSAGEVASAEAVQQLKAYFKTHWQESLPDEDCIRDAIFTANQAIFEINERNDSAGSGRMGTTLVLMLLQDTQVAIANVGDSRLYTYSRRRGLEQLTLDHEVGQLDVLRGVDPEVAYARPESYQLTQALGPKGNEYVDPEVQFFELNEDTIFLLCSDGLSDYGVLEEHAQGRIEPLLSSRASLEQGVGELINLANELSGHDNITAITIRAKVRPDVRTLRS